MILYHGSNIEISEIILRIIGRRCGWPRMLFGEKVPVCRV